MSDSPEKNAYPWLAERVEMTSGEEPGNGSEPSNGTEPSPQDGADAPVVADSPQMNESGNGPAVPFLQSLVDAMRKIADQTREEELAKLRAAVAERAAAIRSETEQRAAELHEKANTDLAGIGAWEQGEIQRIRDEASTKVSARNATLDAQLTANTAAGDGAMTAIDARVDAFEVELTGFFAQLNDIHDPAALASALKRIPQAPSLTDAPVAPAGDTAPSPAAAAVADAAVDVDGEPAQTPDAVEMPEKPAAATVAESVSSVAEPSRSGNGVQESEAAAHASPTVATAVAEPEAEPAERAAEQATVEATVAEPEVVPAHTHESAAEATTQVLVTGLTSFGAITSFKQSLERIDGVSRVSLGLGTSGEFIFTAVHREGFDLAAAIRSFEESAQFVSSNGQLRVTVGSKA